MFNCMVYILKLSFLIVDCFHFVILESGYVSKIKDEFTQSIDILNYKFCQIVKSEFEIYQLDLYNQFIRLMLVQKNLKQRYVAILSQHIVTIGFQNRHKKLANLCGINRQKDRHKINLYINLACLCVCLFVSNKRQND